MLKMICLGLLMLAALALCEEECSPREVMDENLRRIALANNYFAVNLNCKLSNSSSENVIFSPFTLSSVLGMLYNGAEGETAQELRSLLGFHQAELNDTVILSTSHHYLTESLRNVDPYAYTVNLASALIVDKSFPLRPEYESRVKDFYQAYTQNIDIARDGATAVEQLNEWVKTKSKGTIKCLINAIDPATSLLLVSAAYFKGSWRIKFDPKETKLCSFYNGGRREDKIDVPMMHSSTSYRYYMEEGNFTAIELAYEGRNLSLVIFLPEKIDGLHEMEQYLTADKINFVRRYMYYAKAHLTMPKFKLEFNRDLSRELQMLDLKKAFSLGADFSGITNNSSALILNEVRHQATIEVNEEGSVASSISSVVMTKMIKIYDEVAEIIVDHPFLFAILDTRSGLILFMGRVNRL